MKKLKLNLKTAFDRRWIFYMLKKFLKNDNDLKILSSNKFIIGLVIVSIIVLLFSGKSPPVESEAVSDTEETKVHNEASAFVDNEKRLEEILRKIDGAGEVSVMIYYSSMGEKIVASDTKVRSEKTEKGDGVFDMSEDMEHSTVIYGGGGNEKPFVTEERLPEPGGIIVIAEGAKNEKVKYEISEAVRALLGLAPNRIKVVAKAQM